jgi:indole-3-glycerol phosphate synthase/phosphoribosylanthranilate isomerase
MDVLTEVHNEAETARAVALGAAIIGINNRDLRTLEVDPETTARVSPRIPPGRLVVAESGIASRETVVRLRPHADAFLVGSALMGAPDLDRAVRGLVYGRTKICGLTSAGDAAHAFQAGATHGGLMFAAGSPRRITSSAAREVSGGAPLLWVGVFADQPPEEIAAAAADLGLAAVQLHGNETADQVAEVRRQVPAATAVWKAERIRTAIPARRPADRLVLDGWAAGLLGGTGQTFDWSLLEKHPERSEVVLAGGLRAANVAAAAALETWALDASSGVESAPGRKDPDLLRDFFTQRRRLPGRGDSPE